MTAYYNEIDPFAAQWLRSLIDAGHIAKGIVDERSITEVQPEDLQDFTQVHLFAGIGVWSYALRQSGWPDDRRVWTGSCPCQPFSGAGKGKGTDDARHLWPVFHGLVKSCQPEVVMGEQVSNGVAVGKYRGAGIEALWKKDLTLCHLVNGQFSGEQIKAFRRMLIENRCRITRKGGYSWFNALQNDLEGIGYTCGGVTFPACGVGAPHLRQRLYWVADSDFDGRGAGWHHNPSDDRGAPGSAGQFLRMADGGMDNATGSRHERPEQKAEGEARHEARVCLPCSASGTVGIPNAEYPRPQGQPRHGDRGNEPGRNKTDATRPVTTSDQSNDAGPTNGFWRAADWLACRDGKWRPVEPGSSPLVNGATNRVGRLRGYGNAINSPQAVAAIESYMEVME